MNTYFKIISTWYQFKINRFVLLLIVVFTIVTYLSFNPAVIDAYSNKMIDHRHISKQEDSISFLSGVNLEEGIFKVVLIIKDNGKLIKDFPIGKLFYMDNLKVLKEMQEKCLFTVTNSDIATVENKIIVYKNNNIIYESYVVLDDSIQGLQNSNDGWAVSQNANFALYLKQFKRSFWPIFVKILKMPRK